jgi:hypothetical protein
MFKQEHSASSITTHLLQVEMVPVAVGAGAAPDTTDVPTRTLLVDDGFTEEEAEVVMWALEMVELPLIATPRAEELARELEVMETLPALTVEVMLDLRLVVALPWP